MEEKDRVLILGATGYIGRRVVKASIALRHPTFILFRPENVSDYDKCQLFMEFKMEGAQLLQGSLDDHESLVAALKQVDVVISTVAGNSILEQLKLVEAIKEVGTIKVFLMEEKDRVLILGATGYIGRRVVKASIALRHPTFILFRPENVSDYDKCQLFMEFKMEGAQLLQGSLDDHESLVAALKQVDVVISTIAGNSILEQLKLVEAIKEVGTIKRYLPSEFGMDVDRMEHATPPGGEVFKDKRVIRRAIEKANIPYTYVSANCFAGRFVAGLAQLATFMPPRDRVKIYRDGDKKCIWVDELDVGMYTMLAVDDPRTINKVLYIRPPANILTQTEVVGIWERLIGKELSKTFISDKEWISTMKKEAGSLEREAMAHFYDIFYLGVLDFEVEETLAGVDSSKLYPGYKYVTAEEYLKRFI